MSEGTKHDSGKPEIGLVSHIFLFGLATVLTYGARKYGAQNWRQGLAYSRLFNAIMRHLWAWWGGQECDPESGLPHLDHAAAGLMMLREMWDQQTILDDRFKRTNK